jgi:hypothetical protein
MPSSSLYALFLSWLGNVSGAVWLGVRCTDMVVHLVSGAGDQEENAA